MHITHGNGKRDSRYTVAPEFTGDAKPRFVARFCGERIGFASREAGAWILAADHKLARNRVLEGRA